MTPEQFEKLIAILGEVGSFAYQAAYRQAIVDGVFNLIVVFVALVIVAVSSRVLLINIKKPFSDTTDAVSVLCGFVIFSFLLIAMLTVSKGVMSLLNPHWRAIELLAGLAK